MENNKILETNKKVSDFFNGLISQYNNSNFSISCDKYKRELVDSNVVEYNNFTKVTKKFNTEIPGKGVLSEDVFIMSENGEEKFKINIIPSVYSYTKSTIGNTVKEIINTDDACIEKNSVGNGDNKDIEIITRNNKIGRVEAHNTCNPKITCTTKSMSKGHYREEKVVKFGDDIATKYSKVISYDDKNRIEYIDINNAAKSIDLIKDIFKNTFTKVNSGFTNYSSSMKFKYDGNSETASSINTTYNGITTRTEMIMYGATNIFDIRTSTITYNDDPTVISSRVRLLFHGNKSRYYEMKSENFIEYRDKDKNLIIKFYKGKIAYIIYSMSTSDNRFKCVLSINSIISRNGCKTGYVISGEDTNYYICLDYIGEEGTTHGCIEGIDYNTIYKIFNDLLTTIYGTFNIHYDSAIEIAKASLPAVDYDDDDEYEEDIDYCEVEEYEEQKHS